MINITDEKNCCGCGACKDICPKKCITYENRTLGAVFPVVDADSCINCAKCEKVCPMLNEPPFYKTDFKYTFAAYSNDDFIKHSGSSGGMFGTFSKYLVNKGWKIYGAAFNSDLELKCTCATNEEEIKPLMKSKYLQSDMSGKYEEIRNSLIGGESILFVSTPCQVAALKLFLGKDYDNLITVDFFCHGVPSQKFFDECIEYEENKTNSKILRFEFRTKIKNGVTPHYYTITYETKNKNESKTKLYFYSPFYAAFQKYINLRESCYECEFSTQKRVSDITIADFHDIDRYIKDINRFDGVSTVIVHTEKGNKLWTECSDNIIAYSIDLQELIDDKMCFSGGTKRPSERDDFIKDYDSMPFDEFVGKYLNIKQYRKHRLYYSMPKVLRKIAKKVIGV